MPIQANFVCFLSENEIDFGVLLKLEKDDLYRLCTSTKDVINVYDALKNRNLIEPVQETAAVYPLAANEENNAEKENSLTSDDDNIPKNFLKSWKLHGQLRAWSIEEYVLPDFTSWMVEKFDSKNDVQLEHSEIMDVSGIFYHQLKKYFW